MKPHIAGLRRFAHALLRGAPEAADILVEDTIERARAAWDRRRPGGDLRGWLYAILYNRFLSGGDSRRRQDEHAGPVPSDIVRAVAELPGEERAALLLIGLEGLSRVEAARVLGVPIGVLMSRLSRARGQLRRYLEGEKWPRSPLRLAAAEWPCNNLSLQ